MAAIHMVGTLPWARGDHCRGLPSLPCSLSNLPDIPTKETETWLLCTGKGMVDDGRLAGYGEFAVFGYVAEFARGMGVTSRDCSRGEAG